LVGVWKCVKGQLLKYLTKKTFKLKIYGELVVELKITRLALSCINYRRIYLLCFFSLFLIMAAGATEYTVSPFPDDGSGVLIKGEVVELKVFSAYWLLLLWLAITQILSVMNNLLPAKLIFAILGFQIVGKANVLDNSSRDSVYTYIKTNPGVCFSDIAKNTGLSRRTVQYHIQVLETQYKIEVYKDGGKIRCFQNSTYSEKEKKILVTTQNITNKRIISEILNGECNTNASLAREIGISKGTVSWYMKNLKEIGLIKETKRGRSVIYKISISYKNLIEKYK
jgi:predicted transcriptional regulator